MVYPQLIGLVEFCLVLCLGPKKQNAFFRSCPEHFNSDHMALEELYTRIKKCTTCRKMIEQLVSHSQQVKSQKYLGRLRYLSRQGVLKVPTRMPSWSTYMEAVIILTQNWSPSFKIFIKLTK